MTALVYWKSNVHRRGAYPQKGRRIDGVRHLLGTGLPKRVDNLKERK